MSGDDVPVGKLYLEDGVGKYLNYLAFKFNNVIFRHIYLIKFVRYLLKALTQKSDSSWVIMIIPSLVKATVFS